MKLASLFDGSGGFPLAATLCGIEPAWASEVEPYPIAVTRSRFPNMLHLGSVTDIDGGRVEPVDVITFGSPCQDLSVAGKRAGLKHEDNGDDETTRSGLFMEAVRIIKQMREATNGKYPTFAVWENVPGAFSSNKGEDFRTVLQELIKIIEPSAVMPEVPKSGWAYADYYCGDGWSIAYRVLDAQYIRTAQRRRRVFLVLDLGGQRARKILFESDRLRGYPPKSGTPWQAAPTDAEGSIVADDRARECVGFPLGFRPENVRCYEETSTTICNGTIPGFTCGVIEKHLFENHSQDAMYKGPLDVSPMLPAQLGTGGNNQPLVVEQTPFCKSARARSADDATTWKPAEVANTLNTFDMGEARANELVVTKVSYSIGNGQVHDAMRPDKEVSKTLNCLVDPAKVLIEERPIAIDRAFYNQGQNAQYDPQTYEDGTVPTLVAKGPGADCTREKVRYIVRRLTPTECARLQGFPDAWGHPDHKDDFTDEEYRFWLDVRNTHAEINGKAVKEYTKQRMLTWYNKLHTDSAEYKMWGNGVALPCVVYVMEGIVDALKGE